MNNETTNLVQIRWETGQSEYFWNELVSDVLEVFGLPGERYTSHPTADYMDFYFKSNKDAELCRILLSDRL